MKIAESIVKEIENLPWYKLNALTGSERFWVLAISSVVLTWTCSIGYLDSLLPVSSLWAAGAQLLFICVMSVLIAFFGAIPVAEYSIHGLNLAAARAERSRALRAQAVDEAVELVHASGVLVQAH